MDEIKNNLQALFPQLVIQIISYLGSGNDSDAVLVNDEIVFKIPKHQKASNNLIREKLTLDFIQNKVSLPIPHVEYSAILPNGFMVIGCNKLIGKTLTKELFDTLTEKQKDRVARQLATFLKELHQIEIIADDLIVDKKKKVEADYETLITKFSNNLNPKQIEHAKSFFEQIINDSSLYNYNPTLVHNDFSASNILFNANTQTISIIDFGDVAITDRDNDFLCLLEDSEEEYGREFGTKVLKYYGCSNEEIELAIKKTDINHTFWTYEEMLLSEEYNDKALFQ